MEDGYDSILNEIRTEKGVQKIPPVQETIPETKIESKSDWYSNMIGQSKKVGKLIPESEIKLPKEKPQIAPWLSPVIAAPEIVGQLAWGMTSWLPSKITGMGIADLMKLSNALLESEQKSKGRTPEERASFREIEPFSPEKIREMAEKTEAWWHIMPEPATKEAKDILGKVGRGLDWLLGPFKTADEYYTKKGYPIVGYHLRAIGEGLYFKGLHGVKTVATPKLKALRKKLIKKAPADKIVDRLEGVISEIKISKEPAAPEGDALKRVTKSQKIKAHKIQREQGLSKAEYMEIAERLTGEISIKDMNKASAGEFIKELKKGKKALKPKLELIKEIKEAEVVKEKVEEVKVDIKKPEKVIEIPELKDTGEAQAFGKKATPIQVEELKRLRKVQDVKIKSLRKEGKLQEALDESVKGQFYDEALQKVKGTEQYEIFRKAREAREAKEVKDAEALRIKEEKRVEVVEEALEPEPRSYKTKREAELMYELEQLEKKRKVVAEEPISETVKLSISDDLRVAQDMGLYADIREMIGKDLKVGTIMKELKQKPYYKEDLADFGYTEKDVRKAIRAVKAEAGDKIAIKQVREDIKKEEVEVERIERKSELEIKQVNLVLKEGVVDISATEVVLPKIPKKHVRLYRAESPTVRFEDVFDIAELTKFKPERPGDFYTTDLKYADYFRTSLGRDASITYIDLPKDIAKKSKIREGEYLVERVPILERVDPITGRPPGAERVLKKVPIEPEAAERLKLRQQPITGETGKILKSQTAARIRAERLGETGELIKNPRGEGWILKRTKAEQEVEAKVRKEEVVEEQKEWEAILKEEEFDLTERGLGERVDVDVDTFADIVKGERGAITFHPDSIKKLKKLIKKGLYSRDEIIAGLKQKGATDKDITKLFFAISVRIPIGESKWLKKGQSPLEFLPARTVGKTKEGKVLKAPAITREDAHIVATTTDLPSDVGRGLKKAPVGEKLRWAPSEGIFTQLGKPLREVFYRRMVKAHKKSSDYAKELLTEAKKLNRIFSLGSRELHSERLSIYEIAQQPDGIERLRLQEVTKIPKLTPKEEVVYEARQKAYKKLGEEINKTRVATGKRPFPPVKNYTMWAHDMSKLKDFERISAFDKLEKIQAGLDRIRNIPSQIDKLGRTTTMKGHEKLRAGPDMPGYLILDSAENYNVYAKLAADVIHESHAIAYMHELLNVKFGLSENAPVTNKFLSEWLDFQKGHEPIMFIENPKARRLMRTASSNVAVAYLTYQVRPAIVQLASLSLSYSKLGERFTAEGAIRLLSPFEIRRAMKKSNVITTRTPEEILIESQRVYPFFKGLKGKTISKGVARVKRIGSRGLLLTDSIISYLTWLGAEAKGKALYKKLSSEQRQAISIKDFSKNYADDITVQCQGSAARAARSPLQRHAEGKFITTLGTFTIANFDFITRHLMGIKNPDITKSQVVASAVRFVLASAIISSVFTDALRLKSPIPTPIDAFREALETDPSTRKAFQASVTELLEFIPIYGGKYKFDSELMGPVVDQLVKLGKGDYSSLGRLGGMPGYQALWKAYRAERQGGTAIDMIMGRYLEPSKDIATPSLIRREDSVRSIESP